ncbi:MAG: UDP-N-acetylmuramoyl-L-alanyl-D-glutamate--2,6-diaminopimelate ligase [Chlamydiales bacterium]
MIKLKDLLKEIPGCLLKGSDEIAITGISANSKSIAPGNLFIAKKGQAHDGGVFISEAIDRGALAILTDRFDPSQTQVTQVVHPDPAAIESLIAAEYYRHPSDELLMVGITGTNGKTTTSFIIKYLLDCFNLPCGLIGTIEYIIGAKKLHAARTTPDVTANHRFLREMVDQGCRSAVMEVTSHALMQGRVDRIDFDVVLFTNLTQDHLDYHTTMEEYCKAKNQLFRQLGQQRRKKSNQKWAVINQDSLWTSQIIEGCRESILTYGIEGPADLRASHIYLDKLGTHASVSYQGQTLSCCWPLIGRFNVYNCLAAMATLLVQGYPFPEIVEKMVHLPPVRGRLEPVKNALGLKIYVDYAHTDDALINVLSTLSEVKSGKLITVFGCGGDRDTSKRPKMAKACEDYSDFSVVTSDNPRSEDPEEICRAVIQGFKQKDSYAVEVDRRKAICKAIQMATSEDLILIAGKGHETYQIFANQTIEFDDCRIAADICSEIAQS